jgi:DNA helicase INO80
MSNVGEERHWLQDILLSDGTDTSSGSDSDASITEEDFQDMLKFHMLRKKYQARFYQKPEVCVQSSLIQIILNDIYN